VTFLRAVSRSSSVRGAALIVFAAALAFGNTFANGFQLDDFYRVVDNPGIQSVHPVSRHFTDPRTMSTLDRITQYRPLLPLTLSLNYWWGGLSPAGYHALNLALHAAAALLAYALMLALVVERRVALLAALLFAVHPVSGIVVNYVSARDLGMMLAFLLASLLVYVRMRRNGDSAVGWAAALAFAACSILSKTNTVVLPLLVLAFELLFARAHPLRLAPWLRAVAFGIVPAGYFAWTRFGLGFSDLQQVEGGSTPFGYFWTQMALLPVYLGNFAWPFGIRQMPHVPEVGPFAPAALGGLGVLLLSAWLAWHWRKARPELAFCICASWILMLPESSLLPMHHLRVDYRPYPSSVFLWLLVASALAQLARTRLPAITAAAGLFFAMASISLNGTWRTGETLWAHSVRHGGDEVAHMNLAMSIADRRDPRVRANLERSLQLAPGYVLARINYGLLLIELGEREQGLAQCREAVRLAPHWAQAHYWTAVAYDRLGMSEAALDAARTASQLDPKNLQYAYEAAQRAQRAGRYQESLELLRGRAASHPPALFLEAFALQKTARDVEAIERYRRFLSVRPDDFQARFNLGYALMTRGDCDGAIVELTRTLELRPAYHEARVHLAACRARLRDRAGRDID
jgi:Flp pilus assembly protein TadD